MIPLPYVMNVPWRMIGWGALVVLVATMGWRVSAWHDAYDELGEVKAQLEAEQECAEGSQCWERNQRVTEVVGREQIRTVVAYETELASLRERRPAVLRLCPDEGRVRVSGPSSGADEGGPSSGVVPEPARPDPAVAALYELARDADTCAARLRQLQQWNVALTRDVENGGVR